MKLKSILTIALAAALSIAVPASAQAPKSGDQAKSTTAKKAGNRLAQEPVAKKTKADDKIAPSPYTAPKAP